MPPDILTALFPSEKFTFVFHDPTSRGSDLTVTCLAKDMLAHIAQAIPKHLRHLREVRWPGGATLWTAKNGFQDADAYETLLAYWVDLIYPERCMSSDFAARCFDDKLDFATALTLLYNGEEGDPTFSIIIQGAPSHLAILVSFTHSLESWEPALPKEATLPLPAEEGALFTVINTDGATRKGRLEAGLLRDTWRA